MVEGEGKVGRKLETKVIGSVEGLSVVVLLVRATSRKQR